MRPVFEIQHQKFISGLCCNLKNRIALTNQQVIDNKKYGPHYRTTGIGKHMTSAKVYLCFSVDLGEEAF